LKKKFIFNLFWERLREYDGHLNAFLLYCLIWANVTPQLSLAKPGKQLVLEFKAHGSNTKFDWDWIVQYHL